MVITSVVAGGMEDSSDSSDSSEKGFEFDQFHEAYVSAEHRVCGRILRPYCLGHVRRLDALDLIKTEWTDPELVQIARICACGSDREADRAFMWAPMEWELSDPLGSRVAIDAYFRDYETRACPVWVEDILEGDTRRGVSKFRRGQIPWYAVIHARLVRLGGVDRERAWWEVPVGVAVWESMALWVADREMKGEGSEIKGLADERVYRDLKRGGHKVRV